MIPPKVLILHANGANRDHEAAQTFAACGVVADIVQVNLLRAREKQWNTYQILAPPGTFPSTHAIDRTGVLVHLVPDEGKADGPVSAQEIVPLHADDGLESLEDRIHIVEHRQLVTTLTTLTRASS